MTLLDDLRELGQAHITAHAEQVPALPSLEAEYCYLWWEILLVTTHELAAIQDVFVFVANECEVRIQLRDDQAAAVALLGSVPPESFELFFVECEDLLSGMEADALALEADPASRNRLDSLFRGVHSVKGSAGLLLGHVQGASLVASHPLQLLLRMTHGLESLLDPFRSVNAGPVSEETVQTSLETCDAIRTQLASLTHLGAAVSVSPALLARLGVVVEVSHGDASPGPIPPATAVSASDTAFRNTSSQCIESIAGCFRLLEDLNKPTAPDTAHIWETYLRGLKTLSAAAKYRSFTELEEPVAKQLLILDAAIRTDRGLSSEDRSRLTDAFQKMVSVVEGPSPKSALAESPRTAVEPPLAAGTRVDRTAAPGSASTIRIEQNKLDRLMRVVGELLVARGAFPLLLQKLNDGADGRTIVRDLKEAGSNISRISDELQTTVMSIRMLPMKTVFQKIPRLVRDLARSLGKEVQLVVEGEGIELDKTILEQIGDPLVHVIRNSVDHGIEMPEERVARGKEPSGRLTLRAFHETGGVAIEITDDGKGLDAGALKRKAVDRGLLTADAAAAMTEDAAFQLVFLPGLSTAAKVTDISRRGVGMDVVRSNVRNLQGTIEIRSKQGAGTTLRIKLPTSLMISKGILLEAGAQQYILPLSAIRDMVKLPPEAVHRYQGQALAQVRGTIYSIFSLSNLLGLAPVQVLSRDPAATPEVSVAIVEAGAVRYGLVVDKFLTEVEVLVKPLAGGLERCKEFQGAAIMGDGSVVLVLNALECHRLV